MNETRENSHSFNQPFPARCLLTGREACVHTDLCMNVHTGLQ